MPASEKSYRLLLLFLATLLAVLIAYFSPVTNANADPFFSLIVSQSLLENHTLQLDAYRQTHPHLFEQFYWQIVNIDGRLYYNYPLAPSILALPAVAAARLAGFDMLTVSHNYFLQNVLSALLCGLVFILVFLLVRIYLAFRAALVVAVISTFGSALLSTLATAYWNLAVAVVLVLLALLLLARYDSGKTPGAHPYLLGLLLFGAYFTRPSAAIFIFVVFLYLFFKNRPAFMRTAATSFAGFAAFVISSQLQYGLWLPKYYTASQWFHPQGFLRPLYGVTFSPSRGLFIFSPFSIPVILGAAWLVMQRRHAERRSPSHLLYWLCLLWLTIQFASVALTPQWYGGFSFGPRLLADAVPAIVLMTAILWRELAPSLTSGACRVAAWSYLSLGLFAILINSVQGPFNVKATLWNAFPNVDTYPQLLFDWRYPQFLTTLDTFHERRLSFFEEQIASGAIQLAPYHWGATQSPTLQRTQALWHGWWPNARGEWWAETSRSSVILAVSGVDSRRQYVLEIEAAAANRRHVLVYVNDQFVGDTVFDVAARRASFVFDGSLLAMDNTARIIMTVPVLDATPPWTAFTNSFSYNPHELGLKNAAVRLAPLPEN